MSTLLTYLLTYLLT